MLLRLELYYSSVVSSVVTFPSASLGSVDSTGGLFSSFSSAPLLSSFASPIHNITPILCIGEAKEERAKGKTSEVLRNEIVKGLKDIDKKEKVIIAYEPLWSIGTNEVLPPEEIEKVIIDIKKILPKNRILYGGSVTEENIEKLNEVNLIDGYLIGNVSLYPKRVKKLLENLN